jgi:hypothetical protein
MHSETREFSYSFGLCSLETKYGHSRRREIPYMNSWLIMQIPS